MDYLIQLLRGLVTDPDLAVYAFAIAIGLAVGLLVLATAMMGALFVNPMNRRLKEVGAAYAGHLPSHERGRGWLPPRLVNVLDQLGAILLPRRASERTEIQARLLHAGYESPTALTVFHAFKIILAVLLPLAVFSVADFLPEMSVFLIGYAAVVAGFVGLILPNAILHFQEEKRKRALMDGFPDALDLLVACTEAGMGLNAAMQRVADELKLSHPELAHAFNIVNAEIRAGVDRVTALRNLWERTGLDGVRGLASTLSQSMRFGTSVGETLRIYSEEFRDRRMQAAEEQAAKIGTKLIFPLTFCLFPAFFVVAVGPAVIATIRALSGN